MPEERRGRGPRNLIKVGGQNGATRARDTYVGHTRPTLMKVIIQTIPSESWCDADKTRSKVRPTIVGSSSSLEGRRACSLALVEPFEEERQRKFAPTNTRFE